MSRRCESHDCTLQAVYRVKAGPVKAAYGQAAWCEECIETLRGLKWVVKDGQKFLRDPHIERIPGLFE